MVDKRQSPIPLVTEPGLLYSVSGFNSGYTKAGNRPLLHSVESWQENQSFPVYRFLSLHYMSSKSLCEVFICTFIKYADN
jgi:hypothetical protein